MRKLFRMKYEPCNGKCYEYDDVLKLKGLNLDVAGTAELLKRVIEIHEQGCGNAELGYMMDYDDDAGMFLTSFWHYGVLDNFLDITPLGALNKMIDAALAYYKTEEYAELVAAKPGLGHDVCEHGEDHDLRKFAVRHSGLDEEGQAAVLRAS